MELDMWNCLTGEWAIYQSENECVGIREDGIILEFLPLFFLSNYIVYVKLSVLDVSQFWEGLKNPTHIKKTPQNMNSSAAPAKLALLPY